MAQVAMTDRMVPPSIAPDAPAVAPPTTAADNALVRMIAEARLPGARARYEDFLPDKEAISRRRHSPYATWLIYTLSLMAVAIVAWMHFAKVDDVATAPGIVRAAGTARAVSHPDGGRVAIVLVRDGDSVREGQPLLLLDETTVQREIARLATIQGTLLAEMLRLEAEAADRPAAPLLPSDLDADTAAHQLNLWRVRQADIARRRGEADAAVKQSRIRGAALRDRIVAAEQSEQALTEQYAAMPPRLDRETDARLRAEILQRALIDSRDELRALHDELRAAEQVHAEAVARRSAIDREWHAANLKRLAEASVERDRTRAALAQQEELRRNLALRAPVDGVVKALKPLNPGAIVQPGETIAGVVRTDDARRIEIEARVSSSDIGMVSVGQEAIMRFQTYDWTRHGTLQGTVVHVAAEAITPDPVLQPRAVAAMQPYFIVRIALDKDFLGDDPRRNRLAPGMPASVDLRAGERSILDFFTAGFFRTAGDSLRERGS